MNEERTIRKLFKKASEVDRIEIEPVNLTEVDINVFRGSRTPIFHKEGYLYRKLKKDSSEWLILNINTDKNNKYDELLKRIENLERYSRELNEYLENNLRRKQENENTNNK